ncbi:MAG: hypothetical protein DHS20C02_09810 [Micavibrio sp.]|nr:MAG: hypothetical protein DHS20C02_09810 [Micavibrio sp.]
MIKNFKRRVLGVQAAFMVGMFSQEATAQSNFGTIARNITESIEEVPGMITGLAYMIGLLMGVLGILKLKDHVENPTQTPLKDGAVRLAAGGALFALPIVFESMQTTIGSTTDLVSPATVNKVEFNVQ